jgi:hypothetical protein
MTISEREIGEADEPRAADSYRITHAPRNRAMSSGEPLGAQTPTADVYARAWFGLAHHPWTSVALVPANPGIALLTIANAIAAVGNSYADPVAVLTAQHVTPASARSLLVELARRNASGDRSIVATAWPLRDAGVIPIARAVDACVLIVRLGETTLREARETIACIGSERFLGSVTVA